MRDARGAPAVSGCGLSRSVRELSGQDPSGVELLSLLHLAVYPRFGFSLVAFDRLPQKCGRYVSNYVLPQLDVYVAVKVCWSVEARYGVYRSPNGGHS